MLGLKKSSIKGKNRFKRVKYNGFSFKGESGALWGESGVNCDCRGGRFRMGIGIGEYRQPNGKILFVSANGEIMGGYVLSVNDGEGGEDTVGYYYLDENGVLFQVFPQENTQVSTGVERIEVGSTYLTVSQARDATGKTYSFFAGDDRIVVLHGEEASVFYEGEIRGSCAVGNRFFFVTAGNKLLYTAPGDLLQTEGLSDDGGGLYLPEEGGLVRGMKTDGEFVYIFMERDIYRLTVSARASQFRVEKLPYFGDRICLRSQVRVGTRIFFLALDGAYFVDGERVERACPHLKIRPSNEALPCRVADATNLALIEYESWEGVGVRKTRRLAMYYDGKDGYFPEAHGDFSGGNICCLGGLFFRFEQEDDASKQVKKASFTSKPLRLGRNGQKTLKGVRLYGGGSGKLLVQGDGKAHSYVYSTVDGRAEISLLEMGRTFVLNFTLDKGSWLDGVELEYLGG